MHEHPSIALVLFCSLVLVGPSARAQPARRREPDAHTIAAARATFLEGMACADRQDWVCAVERFGRAQAVHASPVILSNLAIALVHVGRLVEASETFRAVARDTRAPADLRAAAERGVADLAQRIGHITIDVVGPVLGVAISVDETVVEAALLGIAIPSDPGDHVIDARRDGRIVASARVRLQAAGDARVALTIPPSAEVAPVVTALALASADDPSEHVLDPIPPARHEIYEEWWLWTLVGVAVVGAGVGIGLGVTLSESPSLPQGSLPTIDVRP